MTDTEREEKFRADFARLVTNRTKIPLETLQTRYAGGYGRLVADVIAGADWFVDWYLDFFTLRRGGTGFLCHPLDPQGWAWLVKRVHRIRSDENRPGGRRDRYRAALIERLDMEEYETVMVEILDRLRKEAYYPYWMRHCFRRAGRIWNDMVGGFWLPGKDGKPGFWADDEGEMIGNADEFPPPGTSCREMPVCRGCGAPIIWYTTAEGKPMPCSPVHIRFWKQDGGRKRVLTLDGRVVSCEYEGDGEGDIGYIPHWAICPCGDDFHSALPAASGRNPWKQETIFGGVQQKGRI